MVEKCQMPISQNVSKELKKQMVEKCQMPISQNVGSINPFSYIRMLTLFIPTVMFASPNLCMRYQNCFNKFMCLSVDIKYRLKIV